MILLKRNTQAMSCLISAHTSLQELSHHMVLHSCKRAWEMLTGRLWVFLELSKRAGRRESRYWKIINYEFLLRNELCTPSFTASFFECFPDNFILKGFRTCQSFGPLIILSCRHLRNSMCRKGSLTSFLHKSKSQNLLKLLSLYQGGQNVLITID